MCVTLGVCGTGFWSEFLAGNPCFKLVFGGSISLELDTITHTVISIDKKWDKIGQTLEFLEEMPSPQTLEGTFLIPSSMISVTAGKLPFLALVSTRKPLQNRGVESSLGPLWPEFWPSPAPGLKI